MKPIYGDLRAAEEAFDKEWRECGGEVLSAGERRLALKCYQMGWMDSEFRFMEYEREQRTDAITPPTPAE